MIKVEMSDLPVEKIKKIRDWLDKEECAWLENCVASEIAQAQAEATNLPLDQPHRTIGDPNAIPPESIDMIKNAAILQAFLDVLKRCATKTPDFRQ
jgi:hypothetical protein